jgi:proline iminopeptidase
MADHQPHDAGMLDVGDGHRVAWWTYGSRDGLPVVVLHGGPGSGSSPRWLRFFNLEAYRVVLFDQRNCGKSTPHASEPFVDLSTNTTDHLLADIELLRERLGIERWMVFGGSWGATLGLAYAQAFPARVTAIVLFSVTNTTRREVEWVTRDMGRIFPAEWVRFRDGVPAHERDGNLAQAYSRLLHDPDPAVREEAARNWCLWEDTHVATVPGYQPDPRYEDPRFRLTFARLVTHYWGNAAWREEGELLRGADKLAGIPGVLVHGRLDISGPLDIAWHLAQRWPDAELIVIGDAGHGAGNQSTDDALIAATNRFAATLW